MIVVVVFDVMIFAKMYLLAYVCTYTIIYVYFVIRQAQKSTRNNSLLLPAMIEFGIPASDPVAPLPPHRSGGSPALEPEKKNRQITHPSFRIIQGI